RTPGQGRLSELALKHSRRWPLHNNPFVGWARGFLAADAQAANKALNGENKKSQTLVYTNKHRLRGDGKQTVVLLVEASCTPLVPHMQTPCMLLRGVISVASSRQRQEENGKETEMHRERWIEQKDTQATLCQQARSKVCGGGLAVSNEIPSVRFQTSTASLALSNTGTKPWRERRELSRSGSKEERETEGMDGRARGVTAHLESDLDAADTDAPVMAAGCKSPLRKAVGQQSINCSDCCSDQRVHP
ncbi:hypothetical protein KUCAC02_000404, partial [Chaenocephalus aceratus]